MRPQRVARSELAESRCSLIGMKANCVLFAAALCLIAGCSLEEARAGDSCRRSTECQPGLACVQGKCSKDLGPIAEQSTVPDLGGGEDAGSEPAAGSGR